MTMAEERPSEASEENEWSVPELMKFAQPPVHVSTPTLQNLTQLNLPKCGISSLPSDLGVHLPNLSILFCPANRFQELPAVVGSCPSLQMVSFKSNQMKRIHPDALQPQLRWLILTDNQLSHIPNEIGRCSILQKLMLSGNQIQHIPPEIRNCQQLELVRLACNQLPEPPLSLLQIPTLAWIALSNNPFLAEVCPASTTLSVLEDEEIDHSDHQVLGQGASGITRKVFYQGRPVAVKAYAGEMTSDGNPQQEKQLALVASSIESDCLIQVLGETTDGSLAMELLERYQALSGPPSMESCSRDVYEEDQTLSARDALIMLQGLLSVLVHLHAKGICHGDLYGHNILVPQDDGKSIKLSDFGAAFFYDTNAEYGRFVEQAEVRAFAILVDEVIKLVDIQPDDSLSQDLMLLAKSCECATSFKTLQDAWTSLQAKGDEHELV